MQTDIITHSYHVTSLQWTQEQPTLYDQLHLTLADSHYFEGVFYGIPCVFFATTLMSSNVPSSSMYPRSAENDTYWYRVCVPLSHWQFHVNGYKLYHFHEAGTSVKQIRLVFVDRQKQRDFDRLLRIVNKDTITVRELNMLEEYGYMWFDGNNWRCPAYPSHKVWINFIVLGQVSIGNNSSETAS